MIDSVVENYRSKAKHEFRLYGFARSGQHAISHWLMSHAPQPSLWLNNIQKAKDYQPYWYGTPAPELDLLGLGLEGILEEKAQLMPQMPMILVVRDIRNQTASLAKHYFQPVSTEFFECWETNVLQALGEINLITSPYIVANFNKWFASKEYRKSLYQQIQHMLDLPYPFVDAGRQEILGVGGGSSFDGTSYHRNADKMKVLERYKDPSIKGYLEKIPPSLLELNDRFFMLK